MSARSITLAALIVAIACLAAMPAFAEKKSPIDPSCLMVCTKWVGDNCEKFEMKCKGDPGYPTANTVKGGAGNAGNAGNAGSGGSAGNAGNAGNAGKIMEKARPNVMDNAKTKGN